MYASLLLLLSHPVIPKNPFAIEIGSALRPETNKPEQPPPPPKKDKKQIKYKKHVSWRENCISLM